MSVLRLAVLDRERVVGHRDAARASIDRASTLRTDGSRCDVFVRDLSSTGFAFFAAHAIEVGADVRVGLAGGGVACARVVWRDGQLHGCAFLTPLSMAQLRSSFTTGAVLNWPRQERDRTTVSGAERARWTRPIRLAVLLGSACLAWAALIAAVLAIV